jgi:hypothetical protein
LDGVSRDLKSPDIFSPALAAYDEILTRSAVYLLRCQLKLYPWRLSFNFPLSVVSMDHLYYMYGLLHSHRLNPVRISLGNIPPRPQDPHADQLGRMKENSFRSHGEPAAISRKKGYDHDAPGL